MKKNIILLILAAGAFSFKAEAASAGQPETILASFQPRQRQQAPQQTPQQIAWHAHAAAELAEQNLCRKLTTPMEWAILKNAPSGEDLGQAVESAIPIMVELAKEEVRKTDLAVNQAYQAQQAYWAAGESYQAHQTAYQAWVEANLAHQAAQYDLEKINEAQQTWNEVRGIIAMTIARRRIMQPVLEELKQVVQVKEDAAIIKAIREIDLVDVD